MAKNPGITIDVQKMPLTAAHEKLLTAIEEKAAGKSDKVGRVTPCAPSVPAASAPSTETKI